MGSVREVGLSTASNQTCDHEIQIQIYDVSNFKMIEFSKSVFTRLIL